MLCQANSENSWEVQFSHGFLTTSPTSFSTHLPFKGHALTSLPYSSWKNSSTFLSHDFCIVLPYALNTLSPDICMASPLRLPSQCSLFREAFPEIPSQYKIAFFPQLPHYFYSFTLFFLIILIMTAVFYIFTCLYPSSSLTYWIHVGKDFIYYSVMQLRHA